MEELDVFHRKQLRSIIGVYYPNTISNAKLYETCQIDKISKTIRNARWRMLGHVLRMEDQIPAKATMVNYFRVFKKGNGFRGAPRTTIATTISNDLKVIASNINTSTTTQLPTQLKTIDDLKQLENLAHNRRTWKEIMRDMQVLE